MMENNCQSNKCLVFYPIPNHEGYFITKEGEVFSRVTNKLLKTYISPVGYKAVNIHTEQGNFVYLHRLLAETFIPNPNHLPEVNHIDGNKLNNVLANLEWVTTCQNVRHAFSHDLTKQEACCDYSLLDSYVERLINDPEETYSSLARKENISDPSTLRKLIKRHLLREGKELLFDQLTQAVKRKCKTSKKVKLTFSDGSEKIFTSQREASYFLGVNPAAVCTAIKERKPCVGVLITNA